MMNTSNLLERWRGLFEKGESSPMIARLYWQPKSMPEALKTDGSFTIQKIPSIESLKALESQDLLPVLLNTESFIFQGANHWFSPFIKSAAKYTFILAFLPPSETFSQVIEGMATLSL